MIKIFSNSEEMAIIEAIQRAESRTTSEIRVHIDQVSDLPVLDVAWKVFEALSMDGTKNRNAALILILPQRKEFAIIGDKGLNAVVEPSFWQHLSALMSEHFIKNRYSEGVIKVIQAFEEVLHENFPLTSEQINELPDEISYS